MIINLISHDNGVGLTQDVAIVRDVLRGHQCQFVEIKKQWATGTWPRANINIFFELLDPRLVHAAPVNIFFPNPEWFWFRKELGKIDLVCAKTRDAERIFNKLGRQTVYTSFTSRDMFLDGYEDKQQAFIHLAGQSNTKGTPAVWDAWQRRGDWPQLYFFKSKGAENYINRQAGKNMTPCFVRVNEDIIRSALNYCQFHLCPSAYEGFGHYIWEAKSCGGIILTTDGEPMRDFITPQSGLLVPTARHGRQQMAQTCHVSPQGLAKAVDRAIALSGEERAAMALKSREEWEENDRYFRTILSKIIANYG